MKTEAPDDIGFGVFFVWWFLVPFVISFYGLNEADANLLNQMVDWVQGVNFWRLFPLPT
jgi:hypothetical protein